MLRLPLKGSLVSTSKTSKKKSFLLTRLLEKQQIAQVNHTQVIKLYDAHTIDQCVWPQDPENQLIQRFLTPLIKEGLQRYVKNIQADLQVLIWDQLVLPITINHAEYDNSYVCSPYNYFFSYAQESLDFLTQASIYHLIKGLLWGSAKVLKRYHVNKIVIVNSWPFSTTLYPLLKPEQINMIVQFLQQQFPQHAIVFRSIDPYTNPICYHTLKQIGFNYIATRQIFFINSHQSSLFESRLFKSDLKLLKSSGYEILDNEQISTQDISRILELYQGLYLEKYSKLNPQLNEKFLQLMLTENLMKFKALRKNGRIDGIVGYIQRNGVMFCPFFGYDRTLSKEVALYRLLSTVLMLESHQHHLLFHQSSGASTFKTMRKAHSCIEYLAVYHRHLSFKRHLPWILLKGMCNSLGVFYMKRY